MFSARHLTEPLKLECTVQHYAWGKRQDCFVKRFAPESEHVAPYAELWIGAHKSASAATRIEGRTVQLADLLKDHKDTLLGPRVSELPLLKVLSIGSALSIQAHPDKHLAQILHERDPKNYPDANDKPEMALALTPLELLYGFRPLEEIRAELSLTPELASLAGPLPLETQNEDSAIKAIYRAVLEASPQSVSTQLSRLYSRLEKEGATRPQDKWVMNLKEHCGPSSTSGGDNGLFSFYLLNLVTLEPGEAIFIGPNTPHSYLSGELVECMNNSDNVVRAGLTPKYKDVQTLLRMLNYQSEGPNILAAQEESYYGINVSNFIPPTSAFCLSRLRGKGTIRCETLESPEILFCFSGEATIHALGEVHQMRPGSAFFIPASLDHYTVTTLGTDWFRVRVPA